jgi:enhancer of polycomb-like protein
LNATSGGVVEEIPAPPADESADIDYDKLYPLVFKKPASYIRFSQTVEECTGCQYDMTTEDDAFLKAFNQKKAGAKCSENDFEQIMEAFEDTASEQAPFASIDNTVIPFETMQLALKQQVVPKVQVFAKEIYEHWKLRRQSAGNTPLQPSLKFEKNQELDDGDPYVCFRRRDARQTRKTRNRDVQSTEKLKRLRKELEEGRELVRLTYQREVLKRDLMKVDKDVFESRAKLKETKVKLGIKADDDDLIQQKVCPHLPPLLCAMLTVTATKEKAQRVRTAFARPAACALARSLRWSCPRCRSGLVERLAHPEREPLTE